MLYLCLESIIKKGSSLRGLCHSRTGNNSVLEFFLSTVYIIYLFDFYNIKQSPSNAMWNFGGCLDPPFPAQFFFPVPLLLHRILLF